MLARAVLQRSTLRLARQPMFRRLITDDIRQKLDIAVKAHPLVLFMKGEPSAPQCGFSRAVIKILELHGVSPSKFASYNVLEDAQLRESIKEYSCVSSRVARSCCATHLHVSSFRQWPTIPQLYVDGEFLGGCDIVLESASTSLHFADKVADCLHTVHQSGKLEELLVKHSIIEPVPADAPAESS